MSSLRRAPVSPEVLREIVTSSGQSYRENSVSYIFTCPRCGKEDKLYLRKSDGRFVCWRCKEIDGFQGAPEYALTEILGESILTLRKKLYGEQAPQSVGLLNHRLRDWFDDDEEPDEDADELQERLWPLDCYPIDHIFSRRGAAYLQGRGISLEVALRYGLRYCPPKRRVFFPIASQGRLFGWQERFILPHKHEDPETGDIFEVPKVLTPKGVRKEAALMFADRLLGSRHAVLTEGPVDGIKADLCGGNVVTMGKAVSRQQIALLRNSGIEAVYLGLDPDAALEILRLCKEFSDLRVYDLRAPAPYKDLGEMDYPEVLALQESARQINSGMLFSYHVTDAETLFCLKADADRRRDRAAMLRRRGRAR